MKPSLDHAAMLHNILLPFSRCTNAYGVKRSRATAPLPSCICLAEQTSIFLLYQKALDERNDIAFGQRPASEPSAVLLLARFPSPQRRASPGLDIGQTAAIIYICERQIVNRRTVEAEQFRVFGKNWCTMSWKQRESSISVA